MTLMENVPGDYAAWLAGLKQRIQATQQRAAFSVNRELVLLYWQIGLDILERQQAQGWGAKVIDRLAKDLSAAFPDMKGFSRRNLLYMRSFAEEWPQGICATACCTNSLGPEPAAADQAENPRGT